MLLIQFLVFGAFTLAVIQELIKRHKLCMQTNYYQTKPLQQFRVIRDHLNSKCLTSVIVFDIYVRSSI